MRLLPLSLILIAGGVACGVPPEASSWYGGAPDPSTCVGRGGVAVDSLCRYETDLRHDPLWFSAVAGESLPRLTPSQGTGGLVIPSAQIGDRIEWAGTGAWADFTSGLCGLWRDAAGQGAGATLFEGFPQGLAARDSAGQYQVLGASGHLQVSAAGPVFVGVNAPAAGAGCWQLWPTRFSLLHCEEIATGTTVPCP